MTKEAYFEMCDMMGSEPIEGEIPVDFEDLPLEVQDAIKIYNYLQDQWDYMNGNYIGKSLTSFKDILEIYEVDPRDYKMMYELILHIDIVRGKLIADSRPKNTKPSL